MIIIRSIKGEPVGSEWHVSVDRDFESKVPLILYLIVQVFKLDLTTTLVQMVGIGILLGPYLAHVVALIVSSSAKLALNFP